MKDGQEVRRVSTAVIAGVCGLALLAGGGIAWWTANRSPTPANTQSSAQTTAPPLSPSPCGISCCSYPRTPSKSCTSATGSEATGSDAAGSDTSSSDAAGSSPKVAAAKAFAADGCPDSASLLG